MTAIWLLSTRGRPRECQETLDACEETGMTSPGVVYVDETVDEYRDIRLPKNWTIHYEPVWGSLQASMQWCFNKYPKASQYGWLADDVRPRTEWWDKALEAAAGKWCVSCARDMWLSESPFNRAALEEGRDLSSGLCWGGELVRTVGWWALPGVRQAWIDVAWCRIMEPLGLARYMGGVIVEHLNYRTGKRQRDEVDDWARGGDNYVERDIQIGQEWSCSPDFVATVRRVRQAADVKPTPLQIKRGVEMMRDSYVRARWTPGMRAARHDALMAEFDAQGLGAETIEIFGAEPDQGPS